MAPDRKPESYHYKFVRENPAAELAWTITASTDKDALLFFSRKLGAWLEASASPAAHRMEKYVIGDDGRATEQNIVKVIYVKPAAADEDKSKLDAP